MKLGIVSIGSSSSGNSYLISNGKTDIILDVGLSAKRIKEGLHQVGKAPMSVKGILVTHEHIDHVRSIRAMSKCCEQARVMASEGTVNSCEKFKYVDKQRLDIVKAGDMNCIGDMEIKTFGLSHDAAEPVGYSFSCDAGKLVVVTDTGIVTEEIKSELVTSDIIVLEANYEEEILKVSDYPYLTKKRILGKYGHLSNVAAAETMADILEKKGKRKYVNKHGIPKVMLAHLSSNNNTPANASLTVSDILMEKGFIPGKDIDIKIAPKNRLSSIVI